jgi:hypothetical protein
MRSPYLYVYESSAELDELMAMHLGAVRVEHDVHIEQMLQVSRRSRPAEAGQDGRPLAGAVPVEAPIPVEAPGKALTATAPLTLLSHSARTSLACTRPPTRTSCRRRRSASWTRGCEWPPPSVRVVSC